MADALLIADLAGRDELMRVQQMYMKKQPSPYMRVVKAIQGNDFVSKFLQAPCKLKCHLPPILCIWLWLVLTLLTFAPPVGQHMFGHPWEMPEHVQYEL